MSGELELIKSTQPAIDAKRLDPSDFFVSLLTEGQEAGILSADEAENMQLQVIDVLQWMITRYNGADSSSIKVEIAERLLLSVLYCIDVFCMSIDDPEECLELLGSADMKEVYKQGLELAKTYLAEAYEAYDAVKNSRIATSVVAYNSTLDEAMPEFFATYDIQFSTHDNMAGIDYPIAFDDLNATAILYIRQYLRKLNMENQFCSLFAEEDIEKLLECYGRIYRIDYPEYLFNIFEVVLTNSIFLVMLAGEVKRLSISTPELEILESNLKELDAAEAAVVFERAVRRLVEDLEIEDRQLRDYIAQCSKELNTRLMAALQQDSLRNLIIAELPVDNTAIIRFEHGQSMDNEDFRRMVARVLDSSDAAEKAEIILADIRSITDFIDVLKADCLFGEDFKTVFEILGDMELSLLVNHIFAEELREENTPIKEIVSNAVLWEIEWVNQFMTYLKGIDDYRLQRAADLARRVE